MANNPPNDNSIEGLLEQRARYEQWLTKLDGAANNAPAAVRSKIRGDYEARLRAVIEQLRGHSSTIAGELERHQASQSELDGQRRQAEEELAEAEVRYAVGEYTEEEWQRIRGDSDGRLHHLREQLGGVVKEITRLAEVQQLIGGARPAPAPSAQAAAPVAPPEPPPSEMIERSPPPPPPPVDDEPVAPTIRTTQPKASPAAAPVDELAFLKSVADDELKPSSRKSNPGAASQAQAHAGSRAVDAPPAPSEGRKSGAPGVAKTLKCGECGTLNRPTEWYCERCGAELAGI